MKLRAFWILWGIDAFICAIVAGFFFIGILDGSVSSFNIGTWSAVWFGLAVILGGSLWVKGLGYPAWGSVLLLVLALPGLLYGLFMFLVMVTDSPWN